MHLPLFPEAASSIANSIDYLYFYLIAVSTIMTVLIFSAVFFFAIKYRRRAPNEIPQPIHGSLKLEIAWSVIPFIIMLSFFWWGAQIFFESATPPPGAMDIYVVGKQWMWKIQYPEGQREINELHVPVGKPVKLTLASEDVIHSFFIPAFRVKHDVVPGRYDTMWFTATKPGRYHLFCAEYCGTEHSGMVGWVTVMSEPDFENWLTGGGSEGTMVQQGERLLQQLGCSTCHLLDSQGRCPIMRNVYGSHVQLQNGTTVVADDAYIRESILNPNAKIVAGFHPDVMPTFQGQISEEGLLQLIVYIKSLAVTGPAGATQPGAVGTAPAGSTTKPAAKRTQPTGGKK
jgi:cytochrome c oxidase subunit II